MAKKLTYLKSRTVKNVNNLDNEKTLHKIIVLNVLWVTINSMIKMSTARKKVISKPFLMLIQEKLIGFK